MSDYTGKYIDGDGVSHLWAKIKAAFAAVSHTHGWGDITNPPTIPSANSTVENIKMDGTKSAGSLSTYARADHVHPTDTSRAASSHSHGSITNAGAITSDTAHASGDKLVIADSSDSSKLKRSDIALGTNDNTYLRKDGSWATPAGTTYNDFTGATSSAAGTHGLVPAPAANPSQYCQFLRNDGNWWITVPSEDGGLFFVSDVEQHVLEIGIEAASATQDGAMTSALWSKLDGIAAGAEVNQNAFSNVKVGSTTIAADSKTDTLELRAGANITLTPDASSDKLTIDATDTVYTHPAYSEAAAAAVKVGRDATGHVVIGDALTYSDVGAAASSHNHAAGNITSGTLGVARGGTGASTLGAGVVYHSASGTGALSIATAANLVSALGTSAVNRATADADGNTISSTYLKKSDMAGLFTYKGTKATEGDLPTTGNVKGDTWNITAASSYGPAGTNVTWDGSAWDALGGAFSISTLTSTEIDAICV